MLSTNQCLTFEPLTILGCRCLVATHYHELARLEEELAGASSHKLLARTEEKGIVFTYKIEVSYRSCRVKKIVGNELRG